MSTYWKSNRFKKDYLRAVAHFEEEYQDMHRRISSGTLDYGWPQLEPSTAFNNYDTNDSAMVLEQTMNEFFPINPEAEAIRHDCFPQFCESCADDWTVDYDVVAHEAAEIIRKVSSMHTSVRKKKRKKNRK
ncbi:uncharacterized protein LOC119662424 [Teleopsis dalmanni]|uniref:uncharacterized protein LOC119662424 n=1 Tax=Teleopsis dalmanni TaxID=139649 RepID=UPI0018CE7ABF|nr:uncharacterized protein LOC119662424 [Teleopsis dalmanni]